MMAPTLAGMLGEVAWVPQTLKVVMGIYTTTTVVRGLAGTTVLWRVRVQIRTALHKATRFVFRPTSPLFWKFADSRMCDSRHIGYVYSSMPLLYELNS